MMILKKLPTSLTISRTILAFIVFQTIIIECRDTKSHGKISDLTVDAIVVDYDALQANITWNSLDLGGRKHDLRVDPVTVDEYCPNHSCQEYGLPTNTTEKLLPHIPLITTDTNLECIIKPGCNISVETTDRIVQQSIEYTVPECVDYVCSCKHAKKLPKAYINATVTSKMLRIYWNVTLLVEDTNSSEIFIKSIKISVGLQNNLALTWGGPYRNLEHFQETLQNETGFALKDEGIYLFNLTEALTNLTEYRLLIRANIVDSKGCDGNVSNFTYRYAYNMFLDCDCITDHCDCVAVQTMMLKKSSLKNWRGIYKNVPNVGFRPIVKFQENFLYGEEFQHCEIPHSALKMGENIGKGAFGSVYLAVADGIGPKACTGLVAVKKLKKDHNIEEMDEFLCEISIMKSISRHPNIVSLIGYCTAKQPMLMVMEYVGCGDLLNYLRRLREQHEQRAMAAIKLANQERAITRITSNYTCSSNPSSHYSNANRSIKSYGNLSRSAHTSVTSLNNPTTITSVNKLGIEVNYLELCHSSSTNSDASYVTKPESVASTKRVSDIDKDYTVFPGLEGMSLDCILDHKELHCFAVQIARSMRHLEERGIIHRDLAARNVLIDENKQLKISDFGLSKSVIYVTRRAKKVPIRWMAIEALRENIYTSKSDVWSFAVVLWEIGTLGGLPYAHVSNERLLNYIADGQRLQRPEICSEDLYKLMCQCWMENPNDRPFFMKSSTSWKPVIIISMFMLTLTILHRIMCFHLQLLATRYKITTKKDKQLENDVLFSGFWGTKSQSEFEYCDIYPDWTNHFDCDYFIWLRIYFWNSITNVQTMT